MKFLVSVLFQSKAGNPCCSRVVVNAPSIDEAVEKANAKVRRYKRCLKINGGDVTKLED